MTTELVLDGDAVRSWRGADEAVPTVPELARYAAAAADRRPDRLAGEVASPVWTCVPFGTVARSFFAKFLGDRATGRLVHLTHTIGLAAPVRPGSVISVTAGVAGLRQTAQGAVVELRGDAVDATGRELGWQAGSFLVAGSTAVAPFGAAPVSAEAADLTRTLALRVAKDQSARYATATGDFNPIHLDAAAARRIGFPAPIVHGLCTMAMTCHALEQALGGAEVALLSTEFARPVFNGDALTVRWRPDGDGVRFEVLNRRRRPVLRAGRLIRISEGASVEGNLRATGPSIPPG